MDAGDSGITASAGTRVVDWEFEDDDTPHPLAEHLIAFDGRLADTSSSAPPTVELQPDLKSALEPAFACLQLLKELRIHRGGREPEATTQGTITPGTYPLATEALRFPIAFGRFELRRELGRGGFGVVFLAFDPSLGREVALKLPRPDCLLTPELKRRFLHEGRAAAGLEHANIVTVFEAGEISGVCYIVSAYCPGMTLADWLKAQTQPVPPQHAAQLIAALADGLEHAHRRGILHRDMKPSNVLLQIADCKFQNDEITHASIKGEASQTTICNLQFAIPLIADFGLAKLADAPGDQTRTGVILGTPQYMAPEQAQAKSAAIGPHTDVYALGVILYELLTGKKPLTGISDLDYFRVITTEEPVRPRRLQRDVPRDLETICLKCLEKEPQRRFGSAGDLAADLRRYLSGEPTVSRPPGSIERLWKWARRRPAVAALLAVSFLAALSLVAAGVWHVTQLAAKNVELETALDDADAQRELARLNSYAAQVRLTSELLQNGQVGQMADVLNRQRPAANESDLREFAWRYLWQQARNEQWLRGHAESVYGVAFSADGRMLASSSGDETLRLWHTATGELRRTIRALEEIPRNLVFSPDGSRLATGCYGTGPMTIRVWDVQAGEVVARLPSPIGLGGDLSFSPDGQFVVIPRRDVPDDRSGAVLLWNPFTNAKRYFLEPMNQAMAAVYSPDGKTLAVACGRADSKTEVHFLDAETGKLKSRLEGMTHKVERLVYSPDGKTLVSASRDDTLRFWDPETGRERANTASEDSQVSSAFFARDGRTLITFAIPGKDEFRGIVKVRDAATGKLRKESYQSSDRVFAMATAPDGEAVALGGADFQVRLWRPTPNPAFERVPGHLTQAWAVAFTPDSRSLISTGGDATVRLWDTVAAKSLGWLFGHTSMVSCVAIDRNSNKFATGSFDTSVKLWDASTRSLVTTLRGHTEPVRGVAFSPDGLLLASAARDNTVKLWDVAAGTLLTTLEGHTTEARGVSFSPDGKWLVSGAHDRSIILWDVAARALATRIDQASEVWCVAFARDGRSFATGGKDGIIKFWDPLTRTHRAVVGGHLGGVTSVAYSPDGRTLATGGEDKTVRLWHVPTGQELICFKNQPRQVTGVTFSNDGKQMAACCQDGSIRRWLAEP